MSEALNVLKAAFGGLREVTTAPLWQYDYGQILQITGLDLPQAFEVHFSNSRKSGETITQIGTDNQVTIPDMFLTSGADIYAFIFLHDGLTDGETEYMIKIPVRERPEPSDIEPTPEQQDVITEAIAALNDAVTQTGEDKEATAALAEAAAASSLIATEAAQSAQASAEAASDSATTASTKASEAALSASESVIAMDVAQEAEEAAKTAKDGAETAEAAARAVVASIIPVDPTLTIAGRAADAKATGDAIKELQSGGYIADQQRIAEKIDAWLDDHPEATTTVLNGSITYEKLHSDLLSDVESINDKAPAIREAGEKAYTHDATGQTEIEVYGNTFESETVKLYDKAQFAFSTDNYVSQNYGVSFTPNGRCYKANGTAASYYTNVWLMNNNTAADIPEALKGKTVMMRVLTDKAVTMPYKEGTTTSTIFDLYVDGSRVLRVPTGALDNSVLDVSGTVSIPASASKWRVLWTHLTVGSVFDNVNFLFLFYDNDVNVYDTQTTVNNNDTTLVHIPSGYSVVDTGAHQNAIYGVIDTKEYIDQHEYNYVTPEQFGAVGDDNNDDLIALSQCIAYAKANKLPVRAFGKYKISDTLIIDGNELDIYINYIRCISSTSDCVKLSGDRNRLVINKLSGIYGGLLIYAGSDTADQNKIDITLISVTSGDGLKFASGGSGIHYNTFRIQYIYSGTGNAISSDGNVDAIQENWFYDTYFVCRNGWAIYDCPGRYFSMSFESACKNGVYMISGGIYTFVGCRYGELVNKKLDEIGQIGGASLDDDEGTLIKVVRGGCIFIGDRTIPYTAIDTSDMPYYSDTPTADDWQVGTLWGGFRIIAPMTVGAAYFIKSGYSHLGKEMFVQAGRKICVPKYDSIYTVTDADFDMRDAQTLLNNGKPYPTKFVIGVANCVIHLSDSYCSMGYKSFIVDQSDAEKLCTIYSNYDSEPIFSGLTHGSGVYRLDCYCDVQNSGRTGQAYVTNTTENDVWTVTKLS